MVCSCVLLLFALGPALPGPPFGAEGASRTKPRSTRYGRRVRRVSASAGSALLALFLRVRAVRQRAARNSRPALVPRLAISRVPVEDLPLDALYLAWQMSYLQLRQTDGTAAATIITARQSYLDELERRDRNGFLRWLDRGATATSDPREFIHDSRTSGKNRYRAA